MSSEYVWRRLISDAHRGQIVAAVFTFGEDEDMDDIMIYIIMQFSYWSVPWVLEAPLHSGIWASPSVMNLPGLVEAWGHTCMWGSRWKLGLGYLGHGIAGEDLERLNHACQGSSKWCERSGKRHWPLWVRYPGGSRGSSLARQRTGRHAMHLAAVVRGAILHNMTIENSARPAPPLPSQGTPDSGDSGSRGSSYGAD